MGSVVVAALATAVAIRRRSASRVLIALAVSTLLARTAVGWATATGLVPFDAHHTLEHALDVVMAGLVLAAVYAARRAERRALAGGRGDLRSDGGERR